MEIKSMDSSELKKLLDNNQVILIDVREEAENRAVRIKEAILIPLSEIETRTLPEIGDKKLAIQCRSGKRSLMACQLLKAQNQNLEPYNLEGGIESWIASSLPIETN